MERDDGKRPKLVSMHQTPFRIDQGVWCSGETNWDPTGLLIALVPTLTLTPCSIKARGVHGVLSPVSRLHWQPVILSQVALQSYIVQAGNGNLQCCTDAILLGSYMCTQSQLGEGTCPIYKQCSLSLDCTAKSQLGLHCSLLSQNYTPGRQHSA